MQFTELTLDLIEPSPSNPRRHRNKIEDADLMRHRHWPVPFLEAHAEIEIERPIGGAGHHAGIGVEIAIALIHHDEIALRLAQDVVERGAR